MMGGPVSPGLASEDSELSPHSSPREWGKCSLFSPFLSFDPWREEKLLWVWGGHGCHVEHPRCLAELRWCSIGEDWFVTM